MLKKLNLLSLRKKLASSTAADKPTALAHRAVSALMRNNSSSSLGRSVRGDAVALPFDLRGLRSNALHALGSAGGRVGMGAFHAGGHAHEFVATALMYLCASLRLRRLEEVQARLQRANDESSSSLEPQMARCAAEMAHWLRAHAAVYAAMVIHHGALPRDAQGRDLAFFECVHRYTQLVMLQAFREEVHPDIEAEMGQLFRTRKFNRERHRKDEGASALLPLRELYRLKYEGDTVVNRKKLFQYQRRPEVVPGVVHERSPVLTAILPSPREKARRIHAYRPGSPGSPRGTTLPQVGGGRATSSGIDHNGSHTNSSGGGGGAAAGGGMHGNKGAGGASVSQSGASPSQGAYRRAAATGSASSLSPPPPRGVKKGLSAHSLPLDILQGLNSVSSADLSGHGANGFPQIRFTMPRDLGAYMATVPWSLYNPEEGPVPLSIGGTGTAQGGGGRGGSSANLSGFGYGGRGDRSLSRMSGGSRASNWVIEPAGAGGAGGMRRDKSYASVASFGGTGGHRLRR